MKKILSIIVMLVLVTACKSQKNQFVSIKNNNDLNYADKIISLSYTKIKRAHPWITNNAFKIINSKTLQEVPYQLEYLGNENPQNVLIQLSVNNNEKIKLAFLKEKPTEVPPKTYGRFVPERADDFAWENDKIAFRTYGKALELTPKQNAYGIDVWVKRTDRMVINERYARGKYHEDHGDGMDYYHVGYTLGAGNCAPFVKDSLWYSKNYSRHEILDNGPLRTTFRLYFDTWKVDGHMVNATKTISLDAGSQLNKIEVSYNSETIKNLPIVIGVIKRDEVGLELFDTKNGILGYWEPTFEKYGTTGVGVVFPLQVDDMKLRKDQYLAHLNVPTNKTFTYYTGAAWDRAGVFTTSNDWFKYLENYKKQLNAEEFKISY
ncbi:DUF4861 family protein [Mariniflexile aquimaris]|uniref:DUF4861 family protein n=1 Tax=Mariniflexile aquimaris TaxID=881009 RepID=A0ABW3BSX3_9FLAO